MMKRLWLRALFLMMTIICRIRSTEAAKAELLGLKYESFCTKDVISCNTTIDFCFVETSVMFKDESCVRYFVNTYPTSKDERNDAIEIRLRECKGNDVKCVITLCTYSIYDSKSMFHVFALGV